MPIDSIDLFCHLMNFIIKVLFVEFFTTFPLKYKFICCLNRLNNLLLSESSALTLL